MTDSPVLTADVECSTCRYNLRGLSADERCPECGLAIVDSIDAIQQREARFGPPLLVHSVAWLRTAAVGLFLFLVGGAIRLIVDRWIKPPAYWWMLAVSDAVSVVGVLLWTIPPMAPKRRGECLRWLTRIALSAWLISEAAYFLGWVTLQRRFDGNALSWFMMWSAAIGTLTGLLYLAHLAGRMRRLLVHRIFLVLSIASMLMIVALIEKASGIYRPHIYGVTLPWPVFPITGQAEDVLLVRSGLADVSMGRETLQHFVGDLGLVCVWCITSISALLWYGMILIGISSKRLANAEMESVR